MSRGVNIPIGADARGVITEGKKVEGALEDVVDALQDVSDESRDAARDTEKNLDSIGDEADKQGTRLERSFKEAFDAVKKDAKTQGKQAGENLSKGVKDGADEKPLTGKDVFKADLKAELVSNAAESGAEIARGLKDGFDSEDVETILDGVSDTIVAVGTLGGPIGTAAGLAASSAMQLLVGPVIEESKERAAEFEATFTTAFDNIVASGEEMGRELAIQSTVNEAVKDAGKLAQATRTASLLGVERGVVLRAQAGDAEALALVQEAAAASGKALADADAEIIRKQKEGITVSGDEYDEKARLTSVNRGVEQGLRDVNKEYGNHTSALDAASEAAKAKGEADNFAAEKAIRFAQKTAASTGKSQEFEATIDGVTRKIKVMPNGKVIEVTDDGTAELTQQEIDNISGSTVTVPVKAQLPTKAEMERSWNALLRTLNLSPIPSTIAAPKGVPYP